MTEKVKIFAAKQKLEITKYEADIPYSQGTKALDRMNAKNLSLAADDPLFDKPLRYTIFKGDLKTFLRALGEGSQVVVDFEEMSRPESEYGPDRTIVQAYDHEGKPVSTKQSRTGGGGRLSLEEELAVEAVKRVSIEGQSAISQVGHLLTCSNPVDPEALAIDPEDLRRIVEKYWKAVERGLDNYLAQDAQKTIQKPQDKRETADTPKADKKPQSTGDTPIKHHGDLLTRASKLDPPVTKDNFLVAYSVNDISEIKDLDEAWRYAQNASREIAQATKKNTDKKAAEQSALDLDKKTA